MRQITIQLLPVILLVASIVFGTAVPQTSSPSSVEGTVWLVTDTVDRSFTFTCEKGGKFQYISSDATKGTGLWTQDGSSVSFELTEISVRYNGTITSDKMSGWTIDLKKRKLEWSAVKEQATVVKTTIPLYTIAVQANITGDVIFDVQIDREGVVRSAIPVSGHPLLKHATEQAVTQWRFNPDKDSNETRLVRLVFAFRIVTVDCNKNNSPATPVFVSNYQVEVRHNSVCMVSN